MENLTFVSIKHFPGEYSIKQGIKRHNLKGFFKSNNVVSGSNGSYGVISGTRTILTLKNSYGRFYTFNIFNELKNATNGRNFTDKFMDKVSQKLNNTTFEYEGGKIKDLDLILIYACES